MSEKRLNVKVNVLEKELEIGGKSIRLERTFTDAYISNEDSEEPVVTLRYADEFFEGEPIIEIEEEKFRRTYGEGLFEQLSISGGATEREYQINIYGHINPVIERK